ncbi:agmatine deiminase family protein [Alteromonas pelagimontana]|uniref:Agmatine deiminase family protein n=1 Tax=Alteromonas pelagimontana TaxID=1858656 RepID=A0A6M4MEV4_9ALTE|nr:agmatine deiminase family protein [Alteromonas pelagimontana]QJR81398.1 agmatine deiminase family protein [Alteromonas pelagimontana]
MNSTRPLIPEWEEIDAVMLAWPHAKTDWAPWLEKARATYLQIVNAVNQFNAGVIMLCHPDDIDELKQQLPADAAIMLIPATYNDTWMRDYGFLTCRGDNHGEPLGQPVEFRFNGWGEKFDATEDNRVNQRYLAQLCTAPMRTSPVVAEGGALEINGEGHLITTAQCLLNPKRNGDKTLEQYTETFKDVLGCQQVTVFHQGHLEGDDTDGHVDTLVRFTPDKGLVIQTADNRPDDSHYAGLSALCEECEKAFPDHEQFRLPLPELFNDDGERLPASYANFLICNRAVLLPVYEQPEDGEAIAIVQRAFPHHSVVPINCATLVKQFGSLHCISMQVPQHTLKESVLAQLKKGVSIYATENP